MDKKDVEMILKISEGLNHLTGPIIHFSSKSPAEISDLLHELAKHQPDLLLSLHKLIKNIQQASENMKRGFDLARILEEAQQTLEQKKDES